MKILSLISENIKKIEAIEIRPDGHMVVIGGANGAGKTSCLDSIEYALSGKDSIPMKPIRKGQEKARVVVELDNLIVKRIFTPSGSRLEVSNKDGSFYKSPQAILDDLTGKLSFDPLEFVRMEPKKQVETLRSLVGLDFSTLDEEREKVYFERTAINRDLKAYQVKLAAMPTQEAPEEEVSISALAIELECRMNVNRQNEKEKGQLAVIDRKIDQKAGEIDSVREKIVNLKIQIEALNKQISSLEEKAIKLTSEAEGLSKEKKDTEEAIFKLTDLDTVGIKKEMADAEQTNIKVRQNKQRARLATEMEELIQKAGNLSNRIQAIDEAKANLLSNAKFPVEGLSFDETGVTFNGIPFEQCSSSEQLRVSASIGFAINPKLRVLLIRDGSLLDEDNLRLLSDMAMKADGQVWLEKVGDDGNCTVVIEDGQVKSKRRVVNNQQESVAA